MSLRMQFIMMQIIKVIMTYDYWICRSWLALNPCKKYQIIYASVHSYSCTCMLHAWESVTYAKVNVYEMSTNKSCWRWSVSQVSTCTSLLRHDCQSHSFLNSLTDSQMYTFPDQMNGQLVQIMASKLPSQPSSSSIYYMNLS